jgi:hypothetical protein
MGRIIDTSESFDISENDIDKKLDDIGKDQEIK